MGKIYRSNFSDKLGITGPTRGIAEVNTVLLRHFIGDQKCRTLAQRTIFDAIMAGDEHIIEEVRLSILPVEARSELVSEELRCVRFPVNYLTNYKED